MYFSRYSPHFPFSFFLEPNPSNEKTFFAIALTYAFRSFKKICTVWSWMEHINLCLNNTDITISL